MEKDKIEKAVQEILFSLLKDGKEVWAQTQGRSMRPLIREGDFVRIKPLKAGEAEAGDVIAFLGNKTKDTIIAHRLVRRNKGALITQGDNHIFTTDPPLNEEKLLGKVIAIKRNGKFRSFEQGFLKYYGRVIAYLNRYGYPLLIFWLLAEKLITEPHLLAQKTLQHLRRIIK